MNQNNEDNWKLSKRVTHYNQPIFKMKRTGKDELITHLSKKGIVQTLDMNLRDLGINYEFQKDIQAIQQFDLDGQSYIAVGGNSGKIMIKSTTKMDAFILKLKNNINHMHSLVNDMLYLQDGKLINCYNNGYLAIWDVKKRQQQALLSYTQIHNSFFYKIRKMDDDTLLTCSNDKTTSLFDIQTTSIINKYEHRDAIWCAYPISQKIFCSAGLFNSLLFWDIRSNRIVQRCQLENQETSFITCLDQYHVIFGDKRDICTCDFRRPVKKLFGNAKMKVSVQNVLVDKEEVVVCGRGGDVCKFVLSQEEVEVEDREVGAPSIGMNILDMLQYFRNRMPNIEAQFEDEYDDDQMQENQVFMANQEDLQFEVQYQNEEGQQIQNIEVQVYEQLQDEQNSQSEDEQNYLNEDEQNNQNENAQNEENSDVQ